jgi:hypothetical protein
VNANYAGRLQHQAQRSAVSWRASVQLMSLRHVNLAVWGPMAQSAVPGAERPNVAFMLQLSASQHSKWIQKTLEQT